VEGVGIGGIVSVDIHLHRLGLDELKELTKIRINEVSAMHHLARKCTLEDVVVIAPDSEAGRWAKTAAEALKTDFGVMKKHRITPTKVEVSFGEIDVSGRNILIVDDIVSTGGTMIETAKLLKTRGAGEISAAFTHPVFSSTECVANLFNAGITELISTNTVQNEFATINVAGLLASALT
jgi:ribose-phosphate pyrophosphokinase